MRQLSFKLCFKVLSILPCLLWRLSQSQDADEPCYLNAEEGCRLEGKQCGAISDRCGGTIDCGACPEACTAERGTGGCNSCGTRCERNADCSPWPYNTGNLNCINIDRDTGFGYCRANINMCSCVPATCESIGAQCGQVDDGCGGVLDCGSCAANSACNGSVLVPNANRTVRRFDSALYRTTFVEEIVEGLAVYAPNSTECLTCGDGYFADVRVGECRSCPDGSAGVGGICMPCADWEIHEHFDMNITEFEHLINGSYDSHTYISAQFWTTRSQNSSIVPNTTCECLASNCSHNSFYGQMHDRGILDAATGRRTQLCGDRIPDGCGSMLNCSSCPAWSRCNASHVCECAPLTCEAAGKQCGTIDDGCNGTVFCGNCSNFSTPATYTCTANMCQCIPLTAMQACPANSFGNNAGCGMVSDGCGGQVYCGGCDAGHSCIHNNCTCTNSSLCPCDARACNSSMYSGARCGSVSNACGMPLECGQCGLDHVCVDDPLDPYPGVAGNSHGGKYCQCQPRTCTNDQCGELPDGCGGTILCGYKPTKPSGDPMDNVSRTGCDPPSCVMEYYDIDPWCEECSSELQCIRTSIRRL
eukprot:SAG31_NODE_398_length_16250_cov_8.737601_2_plen_587_part_00